MIPGEMISLIARRRLVAEVRVDTATQALSVVEALKAGGIGAFEIALTIPGASEILTHFATRTDIIVGAGAVLEARQAQEAISSGARFIASPICSVEVAHACQEKSVACILGALTPTEIITAQRAGAEMVKLFPVEAIGGPAYVRSLLRQLTHISIQVSGGFAVEHLAEYFELPIRSIALGGLLAPPILVERGAWQGITNRAQAFVQFANNPHAYAAQFIALMSDRPRQPQPQSPAEAARAAANMPTMPIPPGAIPPSVMQPSPMQPRAMPPNVAQPGNVPPIAVPPAAIQSPTPVQPPAPVRSPTPPPGRLDEAPALIRPPSTWEESNSGFSEAFGESDSDEEEFRPWDSRPIKRGDDEDWLR